MRKLVYVLLLLLASQLTHAQWIKQDVATTASFRGLSVVNEKVIWASGTGGTVIRTVDGGKKWDVIQVPDAAKLDFRDIEAFDANTAYILSIGNGESSRIYKTNDGGKSWKEQFRNKNEKAFYDAIACINSTRCFAMSDPIDNSFLLIRTNNGGAEWQKLPYWSRTIDGEAAFAASGTCLIVYRDGRTHTLGIVSGGSASKFYRLSLDQPSMDFARFETPLISGSSGSGIFSIAMVDRSNGIIVGGNYEKPNEAKDNLAFTSDGGKTWILGSGLTGYRSGVAYIDKKTIVAVGTNGTDITRDGGKTWTKSGSEDLNAVAAKGKKAVWAVGSKGGVYNLK